MLPRTLLSRRVPPLAGAVLAALATLAVCCAPPARATMQFQQVFIDRYLADHPDRAFVDYVRCQAKCNVCHQGCEDRKNHNAYGRELAKRLNALADRDNAAKILAAYKEVADLPADTANPTGPTFGQRIADAKLPAGNLDDAKREPKE